MRVIWIIEVASSNEIDDALNDDLKCSRIWAS